MTERRLLVTRLVAGLASQTAKKVVFVKVIVTGTFVAWMLHPEYAAFVGLVGNLVWLWLIPEVDQKNIREMVHEAVKEAHKLEGEIRDRL